MFLCLLRGGAVGMSEGASNIASGLTVVEVVANAGGHLVKEGETVHNGVSIRKGG